MPTRPCWVEIHTRALEDNFRFLAGLAAPDAELLAIVKADAYGHSLALCAPAAVRAGARWLGVTCVEEGVAARAICPQARDPCHRRHLSRGKATMWCATGSPLWFGSPGNSTSWNMLRAERALRIEPIAGSSGNRHRHEPSGSRCCQAGSAFWRVLPPASPLRLEGVMTHLFAADEADGRVTNDNSPDRCDAGPD